MDVGEADLPPETARLMKMISERTVSIGVRGQFTADVLAREEVCRIGWPGIYICGASTFADTGTRIHGCDVSVEFPPHNVEARPMSPKTLRATDDFVSKIYDYSDLVSRALTRTARPYPLIPAVMPRWDNTPRAAGSGHVFHGATRAINIDSSVWSQLEMPQTWVLTLAAIVEWISRMAKYCHS
jgi:hypothetical protein